jgi:hypothetical protein
MVFNKRHRPTALLYTDSRGINIPNKFFYPYYSDKLSKYINVKKFICPHKWTTTLDFLYMYKKIFSKQKYNFILLHTGIVDYSPRSQQSLINEIYPLKHIAFESVFPKKEIISHIHSDFRVEYEGDKTSNMYSLKMAKKYLTPQLKKIKNLLWISSNKIISSWKGNYWRDRPLNMKITEDYANLFLSELPNSLNLMNWTENEVKRYTYDNIHPNREGSNYIFEKIMSYIDNYNTQTT